MFWKEKVTDCCYHKKIYEMDSPELSSPPFRSFVTFCGDYVIFCGDYVTFCGYYVTFAEIWFYFGLFCGDLVLF